MMQATQIDENVTKKSTQQSKRVELLWLQGTSADTADGPKTTKQTKQRMSSTDANLRGI